MHIRVTFAGKEALAVLLAHQYGYVLSNHDSGVYCRFAPDALVLIHHAVYGEIPFGLAVPDTLSGSRFPPRTTVTVEQKNSLLLLGNSVFHYGDAKSSRSNTTEGKAPILQDNFAEAVSFLVQRDPHSLASCYAAHMDDLFLTRNSWRYCGNIWENALWNPVRSLFSYESGEKRNSDGRTPGPMPGRTPRNAEAPPNGKTAALSLLGLGPGLTPLGDDILVGYIYALHRFSALAPGTGIDRILNDLAPVLLKYCWEKTSPQSAAFLQSAAKGQYFEMLEACVTDLVQVRAPSPPQSFAALARVGHTSGPALALGILGAARRALREQTAPAVTT